MRRLRPQRVAVATRCCYEKLNAPQRSSHHTITCYKTKVIFSKDCFDFFSFGVRKLLFDLFLLENNIDISHKKYCTQYMTYMNQNCRQCVTLYYSKGFLSYIEDSLSYYPIENRADKVARHWQNNNIFHVEILQYQVVGETQ